MAHRGILNVGFLNSCDGEVREDFAKVVLEKVDDSGEFAPGVTDVHLCPSLARRCPL